MRDTSGKQDIRNRELSDKRNIKKTGDTSDKRDIGRSIGRPHRKGTRNCSERGETFFRGGRFEVESGRGWGGI